MPASWLTIPARTPQSLCKSCGATIYWITLPATGRPHPVSTAVEDAEEPTPFAEGKGVSHFTDCPFADQHRSAPAPRAPKLTLSEAEELPLMGNRMSWDAHGQKPLGVIPDKVLQAAARWFGERIREHPDHPHTPTMRQQVAAIRLVLADREAHSPQGTLAL